jgi:cytochrome c
MPMRRALVTTASSALLMLAGCREEGVMPGQRVSGGDPARGKRTIVAYGCGSCHVIPGVPAADGRVGPPLTDLADRTFIAGRLRNEPVALVRWIRDPRAVDPSTAMPNLGVTDGDARDIAAFPYTLRAGRLGPPRLIPASVLTEH